MSVRSLARESARPTIVLGLICALVALVLLPQVVLAGASTASGTAAPRAVAQEADDKAKQGGKGAKKPKPGKATVDAATAGRFAARTEQAAEDLGLNGEMGITAVQEKFHSGPFAYQWGPECLNGGITQYATTSIGYYGATDGSTPQLNQTYYMGMLVGAGLPCNGRIASTLKVYPPKGTTIAIDAAAGWKVRCFAETNTPRHEVTNDSSADCKAMNAGDGSWYLGTRPLGSGWMFEIYVPVRSSQPLRGMGGNDWWTGHSEVWTASPSVAYPKAIAWAGGGTPGIGISYPSPSATEISCDTAMTTGYLFSQYTAGQAWLQIGTQTGHYPDAAGPVAIGAENQAYTVWARGWGLQPSTTYFWRLIYLNNGTWYLGAEQSLRTTAECDPPAGMLTIDGGHPATKSTNVTLGLTATDASGMNQMRFSNDGTEWSAWQAYATSRAWTIPGGDGPKTVHVQWSDTLGNVGSETGVISLDTVAPTGSVTVNGGDGSTKSPSVTLAVPASDDASGLSLMRFSNDGTTWSAWRAYDTTTSWTLAAGNGTKQVHAQFHDVAGNLSSVVTDTIVLDEAVPDTTAPTGSVVVAGGATWTRTLSVVLTLAAQDADGRVAAMRFSNDGTSWSTWEPFATTKTWSVTTGDGLKTVRVQYRDAAGNVSAAVSDTITLDRTLPVAKVPAPALDPVVAGLPAVAPGKHPVVVSWAPATDASGIARYVLQMSVNGGAWTNVPLKTATSLVAELSLGDGSYRFRLQAIDRAGNASAFAGGTTATVLKAYDDGATTADGTGTRVTYGTGWTQAPLTGAFRSGVRHASTAGATATFTFTGKQVAFVSTLGPRGKVEILLDGVRVTPLGGLDLYRPGAAQPARVLVVKAVGTGSHTLTIKVLGAKHAASASARVDVDAFLVLR